MDEPLQNSEGAAEAPKRPRGRPFQPGQSGNPKGRPRTGHALAEAIREKVPPEVLIQVALQVMRDASGRDKIAAARLLADFAYVRPEQRHELVMGHQVDEAEEQRLLEQCTTPELEELHRLETRRAQILEAAAARGALPAGQGG